MKSFANMLVAVALSVWACPAQADAPVTMGPYTFKMSLKCDKASCKCRELAEGGFAGPAISTCTSVILDANASDMQQADAYFGRSLAYYDLQSYDQAIADSTADLAIETKRDDQIGIAAAYDRRADIYFQKADDEKANADYNAAVAADEKNPKRYSTRGSAYALEGKSDLALADFATGIGLAGRQHISIGGGITMNVTYTGSDAYLGRGWLYFLNQEYGNAAADFAQSLTLEPGASDAIIWLHLTRLHQGVDDRTELAANTSSLNLEPWSGPLLKLFLGQATPQDVLVAETPADHQINLDRVCDGSLAIAEWDYFGQHDSASAKRMYGIVANTCLRSLDKEEAKLMLQKIP